MWDIKVVTPATATEELRPRHPISQTPPTRANGTDNMTTMRALPDRPSQ